MSDRNREAGDNEGPEDAENNGDEYEVERHVTREEGAAVLRRLADGVANGSVELDDGKVIAAVPEQFDLEIEYEQDSEMAELEAELEWPVADAGAVAAAQGSEARESGDRETGDDKEPADEEESAMEADADRPIDEIVGIEDAASKAQFELYRDRANEWRWRLVHDNGNIIADSGEGYDRKATARNGLESVMRNAPGATVVETDD